MTENIGTVQYASLLYDFYGALLGESQAEVMTLYHEDNLSLSEIAEELGQTRQAVHYTLKKAESRLEEYEAKLGLVKKYEDGQEIAEAAIAKCAKLEDGDLGEEEKKLIGEIKAAIESLAE